MSLHIDAGGVNAEKLVLNRRSVKMSDLLVWSYLVLSTLTVVKVNSIVYTHNYT